MDITVFLFQTAAREVMPFSYEDKIIIKHYRQDFKWGRRKLIRNFPQKIWSPGGLDKLLRKIDETNGMIRNAIPLEIVDRAINAFRNRLRMCIKANGGHIEHFL